MGFGKKVLHLKSWDIKKLKKTDLFTLFKILNFSELATKPDTYNAIIKNLESLGLDELCFPQYFDCDDQATVISHDIIVPIRIKAQCKHILNLGTVYSGRYPSVTTILNQTRGLLTSDQVKDSKIDPDIYNISEHVDSSFHQFLPHWMVHFRSLYKFKKEIPFALEQASKRNFEVTDQFMSNLRSIMRLIKTIYMIKSYESFVVHPLLGYAGMIDYVGHERLINQLIEWKTLNKKRKGLHDLGDIPLQAVAYLGAVNYDPNHPYLQIPFASIGVLYNNARPCDLYKIDERDLTVLWAEWLRRLVAFKQKFPFLYEPLLSYPTNERAKQFMNVEFKKKMILCK